MLTGPSGVGKSTLCGELLKHRNFLQLRSHTTRPQRPYEPSTAYHFVTPEVFKRTPMVEQATYQGNLYGLSYAALEESRESDVIHCASCETFPQYHPLGFTSIMLLAPSEEELIRRIRQRDGKDDRVPIALDEHRIARSLSYHACVMNDDLVKATADVLALIDASKRR